MKPLVCIGLLLIVIGVSISCENDASIEFKRYYSNGAVIYQAHCQNCHGAHGEGLAALVPPLSDGQFLKSNRAALACMVRNGLRGKITVRQKVYDDSMTGADLAPMEMAQVLTFIGNSFGNRLGVVTIDQAESDIEHCK